MNKTKLSVARPKDREQMARMIESLCVEYGATCQRSEYADIGQIRLEIGLDAVTLSIVLDAYDPQTRAGVFCLPWRVSLSYPDLRLSDAFGRAAGAEVNKVYRHKCTAFAEGFDSGPSSLIATLENCFGCILAGDAFEGQSIPDKRYV